MSTQATAGNKRSERQKPKGYTDVTSSIAIESNYIWISYQVYGYTGYPLKVRLNQRTQQTRLYQHINARQLLDQRMIKAYAVACHWAAQATPEKILEWAKVAQEGDTKK